MPDDNHKHYDKDKNGETIRYVYPQNRAFVAGEVDYLADEKQALSYIQKQIKLNYYRYSIGCHRIFILVLLLIASISIVGVLRGQMQIRNMENVLDIACAIPVFIGMAVFFNRQTKHLKIYQTRSQLSPEQILENLCVYGEIRQTTVEAIIPETDHRELRFYVESTTPNHTTRKRHDYYVYHRLEMTVGDTMQYLVWEPFVVPL